MAALNLLEGKPTNEGTEFELDETGRWLMIPFEAVTKDNVSEYDNR